MKLRIGGNDMGDARPNLEKRAAEAGTMPVLRSKVHRWCACRLSNDSLLDPLLGGLTIDHINSQERYTLYSFRWPRSAYYQGLKCLAALVWFRFLPMNMILCRRIVGLKYKIVLGYCDLDATVVRLPLHKRPDYSRQRNKSAPAKWAPGYCQRELL